MKRIKFGTDGWRAVIAKDYTVENLGRLGMATANWVLKKYQDPKVIVGYDCRFGGEMFAMAVAKVMGSKGIKVFLSSGFTSTPAVSLAVIKMEAQLGIMITASHNPADYNGYKLKASYGGPVHDDDLRDIENMVDYENQLDLDLVNSDKLTDKGLIEYFNPDDIYIQHVKGNFHMDLLNKSAKEIAFDPMYGSGQRIMSGIAKKINIIHGKQDFSFNNIPPEPLEKNLHDFSSYIKKKGNIKLGLAVDGDADRIALLDEKGKYIDSHHIILLLIHYLAGYRQQKGIIVTGFSSTVKVEKLAEYYRLPVKRVKIGFKQIAQHMIKSDVLVGGEESGGIGVKGHIPERDGIWMGMLIWQWMEESGKSLTELIKEIYDITGKFAFARSDLKLDKELKSRVMNLCLKGDFTEFGKYKVQKTEDLDGFKFFFNFNTWLMIRPSGTEPVLRTYSEAETEEEAKEILQIAEQVIRQC